MKDKEEHRKLSDEVFLSEFTTCRLETGLFTHEAHLRLAWIQLKKYDAAQAIENIQILLKRYVKSVNAESKYNMTITVAASRAVHHFMLKSKSSNFIGFIHEFPRLKTHFKDLMAAHYSFDIFNSEMVKEKYVEPDLVPFD